MHVVFSVCLEMVDFSAFETDQIAAAIEAAILHALHTRHDRPRTDVISCVGEHLCSASSGDNDESLQKRPLPPKVRWFDGLLVTRLENLLSEALDAAERSAAAFHHMDTLSLVGSYLLASASSEAAPRPAALGPWPVAADGWARAVRTMPTLLFVLQSLPRLEGEWHAVLGTTQTSSGARLVRRELPLRTARFVGEAEPCPLLPAPEPPPDATERHTERMLAACAHEPFGFDHLEVASAPGLACLLGLLASGLRHAEASPHLPACVGWALVPAAEAAAAEAAEAEAAAAEAAEALHLWQQEGSTSLASLLVTATAEPSRWASLYPHGLCPSAAPEAELPAAPEAEPPAQPRALRAAVRSAPARRSAALEAAPSSPPPPSSPTMADGTPIPALDLAPIRAAPHWSLQAEEAEAPASEARSSIADDHATTTAATTTTADVAAAAAATSATAASAASTSSSSAAASTASTSSSSASSGSPATLPAAPETAAEAFGDYALFAVAHTMALLQGALELQHNDLRLEHVSLLPAAEMSVGGFALSEREVLLYVWGEHT